jgi:hypothetical protein
LAKFEAQELPPDNNRWVSLQGIVSFASGVSLRIGALVVDVESGFDRQLLVDAVRALMAVC